jgi:hypothetical protein
MARRQSRRTVSLNRQIYEALALEATRRGMTPAGLVEFAIASIGVPVVAHSQQSLEQSRVAMARRAERRSAAVAA